MTLRNRAAEIHPSKRASRFVLHTDPTARQICLHTGGDSFMEGVDVSTVFGILRHRHVPDATDQVSRDVTKFSNYKRTDQLMEISLLGIDILRTKDEKKI